MLFLIVIFIFVNVPAKDSLVSPDCLPPQGSIQQLVIKFDPRAAEEQCEDDDPYVRYTDKRTLSHHKYRQDLSQHCTFRIYQSAITL